VGPSARSSACVARRKAGSTRGKRCVCTRACGQRVGRRANFEAKPGLAASFYPPSPRVMMVNI
jgi:hypothetical protein